MGWYSCYKLIVKYEGDLQKAPMWELKAASETSIPRDRKKAWRIAWEQYHKDKGKGQVFEA